MPLLFHFRQSYKMQGSFAKLSNFGDEIFTSKPAVTKNILGSQALMTPSSLYHVNGNLQFRFRRLVKADGVWVLGITRFGKTGKVPLNRFAMNF